MQNTTAISAYAFVNAPIKKLTLGDKVSSIGNSAFWGSKIVMATIGAGVETFGSNVFAYCKSLVEMYNKSSTEITADNTLIFGDYYSGAIKTQVLNIYTQESNSKISKDSNGFIVYNDGTSVILLGYEGQETYIRLPSNITSINANAFFGNNKLRSVSLGSSVSSVLEGAFSDCSELSSVNLSSSCQLIGRHAFKNCKNLFSITIPSSVEEIGSEAFYGCRLVFATFKITAGWKIYYTGNSYRETILEKDLYSETNAANLLITKYVSYVWINEQ